MAPTGPGAWSTLLEVAPEVLLIAPCGFRIKQSQREMPSLTALPGFAELSAVRARPGRHHRQQLKRPGPRLVESPEMAAAASHPTRSSACSTSPPTPWRS